MKGKKERKEVTIKLKEVEEIRKALAEVKELKKALGLEEKQETPDNPGFDRLDLLLTLQWKSFHRLGSLGEKISWLFRWSHYCYRATNSSSGGCILMGGIA